MHFLRPLLRHPLLNLILLVAALAVATPRAAHAEALLVVEAETGKVLQAENATMPWYPASVTKIMTAYVTLKAVKEGRLRLDSVLTVSPVAASQSPSKMGFKPGTQVTVENALAMVMVKSANDMAVVLAEGVGGSVDGFSGMMNATAQRLGMTQTSYVNPNGLPADGQITSARDLAILARAVIRDLPEYEYFMHIPAIRFGRRTTNNFNKLIGRYAGADGFKTGFICASGYNLVASATRDGKRLIAVVLGSTSGQARAVRAAQLLERGFASNGLGWLRPSLGTVDNLVPIDATPPNLREEMCNGRRKRPATDEDADTTLAAASGESPALAFFSAGLQAPTAKPSELLATAYTAGEPMVVYTGPKKTGPELIAAVAADDQKQTTRRGKKSKVAVAAKKPDADKPKTDAKTAAKSDAKPAPKPAAARHANVKPDTAAAKPAAAAKPVAAVKPAAAAKPAARPAEKPAASGDKPAAKPAKPKAAAKPKSESKPAG
ncbi:MULTISPECIES: D-alanyl-D-alanine carboxypeptidase family protein [unclassified Bradyrhizobium]|uniref:D-alanyl-D-alanine carboxypeptidase family protein n=1 Tax=unclassified Bradyrhizobium TaxID=2631580 RepID=UPI001BA86214|nr:MULTISPECIES: D-alanyl-D-alanine carboxypeptidase family protein [unclassified Bradyrhizobium]MBR1228941.1 D-alanyl-D-alanine carboxypeptidase [Bradyrhizobium sp. AUGA SZCCT0176]MBR1237288.1 D-alanyl-D-alanine carboxypeptidase [Bradyrhizobium sp. AUGA SZCCT0182]MBR1296379.1 D-alanyl-D-alanine carboxypeptidase [Bradyrhizobium sp. AUGA SZCCT0042]